MTRIVLAVLVFLVSPQAMAVSGQVSNLDFSVKFGASVLSGQGWEAQLADVLANLDLALENKVRFIAATYEEPTGFGRVLKLLLEYITLGKLQLRARRKPGTKP